MTAATTTRRLPAPIVLALSWPQRLFGHAAEARARLAAWRGRSARAAAERRQAALHRALVSQLDAATLRDLGLGDRVSARGAGRWVDVDRF